LDGNGSLDLVVDQGGSVYSLLNPGMGNFPAPRSYGINSTAFGADGGVQLFATDLNRDGKPDLIAIAPSIPIGYAASMTELTALINNGDGTFRVAASYDLNVESDRFDAVGDFNGDGVPDVYVMWISGSST